MEIKSTNTQDIECAIRTILSFIGENPCREGLKETPDRIIRMWKEIFRGYDLAQVPKITVFPNGVDGLSCNSVIRWILFNVRTSYDAFLWEVLVCLYS